MLVVALTGHFSEVALETLEELFLCLAFVAGLAPLGWFYRRTPVEHLRGFRRSLASYLLLIGGLMLFVSCFCLVFAPPLDALIAIGLTVVPLWLAAVLSASVPASAGGHAPRH